MGRYSHDYVKDGAASASLLQALENALHTTIGARNGGGTTSLHYNRELWDKSQEAYPSW